MYIIALYAIPPTHIIKRTKYQNENVSRLV